MRHCQPVMRPGGKSPSYAAAGAPPGRGPRSRRLGRRRFARTRSTALRRGIAEDHYHVPPLERVNLDEILELLRDKRYFVMHGDTLISVLRQLRARHDRRPAGFPQSVVLCGVRDVP